MANNNSGRVPSVSSNNTNFLAPSMQELKKQESWERKERKKLRKLKRKFRPSRKISKV